MPESPSPLASTANALDARLNELAGRMQRAVHEGVPGYDAELDPALSALVSDRITAALRSIVAGVRGEAAPGQAVLQAASNEARAAAQAGIDINALIQTYRVLQAAVWDVLLEETTR